MTIKVHHLRPAAGAKTAKTRVGRGEASKGKTAGRGTKGTKARKNVPAGFEGGQMPIHMRLPKLKGFRNRFRTEYQVVNVGDLARLFPDGGTVGPEELVTLHPNDVIDRSLELCHYQILKSGVELHKRLEPGLPDVKGVSNQLEMALINLVVNAVQSMGQGTAVRPKSPADG